LISEPLIRNNNGAGSEARLFSPEAEMSVVGGMFIDADAIARAADLIQASDFHAERHRILFRAMLDVWRSGGVVDAVTLSEYLKNAGAFEAAGGAAYLAQLMDAVPTAANIEYHARIVRERALERQATELAKEIAQNPRNTTARELLSKALADLSAQSHHRPRFQPLTDEEVEALPPPEQLLNGILIANSLAVLVGAPEGGKTFLALSWALSIATGVPWCGRSVRRGPTLYVAAEGTGGLGKRLRAWKVANHRTGSTDARFVTVPVAMLDPAEHSRFVREAIQTLPKPPVLIILDTLNRTFIGGDENSSKDMGEYVRAADRLREETGATVLIVHHAGWDQTRERGSSVLRGAADTMMLLKTEDERITLTCTKQKDLPHFDSVELRLVKVAESCVLLTADRAPQLSPDELTEKQVEALRLLRTHFLDDGATATAWMKASGFPERTFYDARTALVRKGYVTAPTRPRGGRYTLSRRGEEFLTANCGVTAEVLRRSKPTFTAEEEGALYKPLDFPRFDGHRVYAALGVRASCVSNSAGDL
jgi:hypothetical protein